MEKIHNFEMPLMMLIQRFHLKEVDIINSLENQAGQYHS